MNCTERVYERIDHKYLERGHTYLENDRDFAQIEKRKKTATVYLPQDWVEVMRDFILTKPFERQPCSRRTSLIGKVLLASDTRWPQKIRRESEFC